jgi:phosphoglycerol geranylgeranyltransferase
LFDPDPKKLSIEEIADRAEALEKYGSSAFLIGGSTGVTQKILDATIMAIKDRSKLPAILFPGNAQSGISRYADAIFFMSLLNSKSQLWITGMQAMGANEVKQAGIEPIPVSYLIIEPGMKAGKVGKAKLIKQKESYKAAAYALAAQYMGMRFVYLEAGSGATKPVPDEMIMVVRGTIRIPLIVGGGLRSAEAVEAKLRAGADIIVTGNAVENNFERMKDIVHTITRFRKIQK